MYFLFFDFKEISREKEKKSLSSVLQYLYRRNSIFWVSSLKIIMRFCYFQKANISIYFERGHELHRQTHDGLTEYVMDLLKGLGMNVEYRTVEQQVTKTKAETIEYIKNRSVSSWEMLTDQEIADGVKEVEEKFGDVITVNGEKEIIIASK